MPRYKLSPGNGQRKKNAKKIDICIRIIVSSSNMVFPPFRRTPLFPNHFITFRKRYQAPNCNNSKFEQGFKLGHSLFRRHGKPFTLPAEFTVLMLSHRMVRQKLNFVGRKVR